MHTFINMSMYLILEKKILFPVFPVYWPGFCLKKKYPKLFFSFLKGTQKIKKRTRINQVNCTVNFRKNIIR